ncbi:uncharacterized protein [Phyllobates terribilis]|uniref:uncharacterized protein n=1 Tax=Phyllobates terribilis TaxID=111132 RepID=UPI003CCB10A1
MKIALFFLLVGLSSCFVSADQGGIASCHGKLSFTQAEVLITLISQVICKYAKIKERGMKELWEVACLVDMTFIVVRTVASYKKCDVKIIFNEVMACLKISQLEKDKLKSAFVNDNPWQAATFNADPHDLIEAVCCSAAKFINAEGLDFVAILNVALFALNGYVGSLVHSVAGLVGSLLHLSSNVVESDTGLVIQVSGVLTDLIGVVGNVGALAGGVVGGVLKALG